jgi:hypothetical protein
MDKAYRRKDVDLWRLEASVQISYVAIPLCKIFPIPIAAETSCRFLKNKYCSNGMTGTTPDIKVT